MSSGHTSVPPALSPPGTRGGQRVCCLPAALSQGHSPPEKSFRPDLPGFSPDALCAERPKDSTPRDSDRPRRVQPPPRQRPRVSEPGSTAGSASGAGHAGTVGVGGCESLSVLHAGAHRSRCCGAWGSGGRGAGRSAFLRGRWVPTGRTSCDHPFFPESLGGFHRAPTLVFSLRMFGPSTPPASRWGAGQAHRWRGARRSPPGALPCPGPPCTPPRARLCFRGGFAVNEGASPEITLIGLPTGPERPGRFHPSFHL